MLKDQMQQPSPYREISSPRGELSREERQSIEAGMLDERRHRAVERAKALSRLTRPAFVAAVLWVAMLVGLVAWSASPKLVSALGGLGLAAVAGAFFLRRTTLNKA